jgi:hypothetical protein
MEEVENMVATQSEASALESELLARIVFSTLSVESSLDYGNEDGPLSLHYVTVLNLIFLSSRAINYWNELKACKRPCCSEIHSVSLQFASSNEIFLWNFSH